MLIVKVDPNTSIEKALKQFKSKVIKTKLMSELRNRKEFTKKSIIRRTEINKAKYVQQTKYQEND
jgi:small subunit ribosomal protein S21